MAPMPCVGGPYDGDWYYVGTTDRLAVRASPRQAPWASRPERPTRMTPVVLGHYCPHVWQHPDGTGEPCLRWFPTTDPE